jgi:hypothetical protein
MGVGVKVDKGRIGFRAESGVIHPGAVEARIMVLIISYRPFNRTLELTFHSRRVSLFAPYRYRFPFRLLPRFEPIGIHRGKGRELLPGLVLIISSEVGVSQLTSIGEECDQLL